MTPKPKKIDLLKSSPGDSYYLLIDVGNDVADAGELVDKLNQLTEAVNYLLEREKK